MSADAAKVVVIYASVTLLLLCGILFVLVRIENALKAANKKDKS